VYNLNSEPLKYLNTFNVNINSDIKVKNAKYHTIIDHVDPSYKAVLEYMYNNIKDYKKFQYVDVKVQSLKVGENSANGHWHLDSSLNPKHDYENYLFVCGVNTTEFVKTEVSIDHQESSKAFNDTINSIKDIEIIRLPTNTVVKYNGKNVHRGVDIHTNEVRLLLRMINTDHKLPSYKLN
jgi:hypothetical protein